MSTESNLSRVHLIELPKVIDCRGNLTHIEAMRHVPLEIKRVYYIYDVPGGAVRGAHAQKTNQSLLIAISGSFRVNLSDGVDTHRYELNRADCGLYVPPMIWRKLDNFSTGSLCLALASNLYDADDYYRDYAAFLEARGLEL